MTSRLALLGLLMSSAVCLAQCPCDSYTTFGLDPEAIPFLEGTKLSTYLGLLGRCHECREDMGIRVNYCAEPVYWKLAVIPPESRSPAQEAVVVYYENRCFEVLADHDLAVERAGADPSRALGLPRLAYRPPMRSHAFVAAGIPLLVAGVANTPYSVANLIEAFSEDEYSGDLDFTQVGDELGALIYLLVSVVADVAGTFLTTFGVRKNMSNRDSEFEYRQMMHHMELSISPEGEARLGLHIPLGTRR